MAILKQEVFVDLCASSGSFCNELSSALDLDFYSDPPSSTMSLLRNWPLNREAALEVFAYAKNYLMREGYYQYKALRPWDWDASSLDSLDPEQPWWGFEFETGYQGEGARSQVIEFTWDNFDNVCFDAEGEGGVYSEITFGPAEQSKFVDGTADAFNFIKYLNSVPNLVNHTGLNMIGTHLNLSVPWARGNYNSNEALAHVMNNTLHMIPRGRQRYFGRKTIYGGAFSRDTYIELKLFRTTYSMDKYKDYLKSADALTRIALAAEHMAINNSAYTYCSNFEELWNNPDATPTFVLDTSLQVSPWETYISGREYDESVYDDEEFF